MSVSLTGNDTVIIGQNGIAPRIFTGLADGDTAMLEFPNDIVTGKIGKNGNTIFAFNATGQQVNATIRLIRGSADDKYMNARYNEYIIDTAAFLLLEGEFVKRVGDGSGTITADTYRMAGGVIQRLPDVKENVEGDIEQSVSVWRVMFTNVNRALT